MANGSRDRHAERMPAAWGGIRHAPWVFLYAVAMGYVEAALVVYLRAIYYPEGFRFPLVSLSAAHTWTEIGREAATLVMLVAVAILAGVDRWRRLLAFLVLFGLWDLAYYAGLWVLEGWPHGLGEQDLLFLIPVPWLGPVWAPMGVALSMVVLGLGLASFPLRAGCLRSGHWIGFLLGGMLLFLSFTAEAWLQLARGSPASILELRCAFPWWLYLPGLILVWTLSLRLWARCRAGSLYR